MEKQEFESLLDKGVWRRGTAHLARRDKVLGRIIRRVGYPNFEVHENHYSSLIVSIVSQQISWAAANSILRRFRQMYKGRMPTPKEYLKTKNEKLRGAGISPQKCLYLKDLCERIENGALELKKFHRMPNEMIIEELDEVKGIGRWTAEMFLIFSLGRTDVFPMDDLGIRKAVKEVYGLRDLPDKKKLEGISRVWRPYGSIAALYLWHSHD
ncbi:MAG: DNA-3-methyladenine glycosylase 2 family protein [Candidatus Micrarchaeota archaeon]|nr:DNA-3-methyladenine glycosylase 2 family protein [Candidatus Micrarchaeota archaeon]